jgi:2-succinyl-5-enolpyruvyl-6-hydroxy-3-cyclohexene-1-carboxylate synthase
MAPLSGLAAPSTIDTGFMLSVPQLENPYTSDDSYQRVLEWYLPLSVLNTVRPKLSQFGEEAISEQIHQWVANAEKEQPYVKTHDVWGKPWLERDWEMGSKKWVRAISESELLHTSLI